MRLRSDESAVTLLAGRPSASVHAYGYLELNGTQTPDALDIALRHPTTIGGVLFVRDDAFTPSSPESTPEGVRVSLRASNAEFARAVVPCDALILTNDWQQSARARGFADEPPAPPRCALRERHSYSLAYYEGWVAGRRARIGTRERAELGRRVARTHRLRVRPAPHTSERALDVQITTPADFVLQVLEERRGWTRVHHAWGDSYLEGWVRSRTLGEPSPAHPRAGDQDAPTEEDGRADLEPSVDGIVAPGTPVFASETAARPWAVVRGSESVRLVLYERRAEIVIANGIEVHAPGAMWVPRTSVQTGIFRRNGLELREVVQGGTTRTRVHYVDPRSHLYEVGLRASDVVERVMDSDVLDLPAWSPAALSAFLEAGVSVTVRRGERFVQLQYPCRIDQLQQGQDPGPVCCTL